MNIFDEELVIVVESANVAGVFSVNGKGGYVTVNEFTGDLSKYYTVDNPSGFITGVDLSNYVTKSSGEFLTRPTVNGTGILISGDEFLNTIFHPFLLGGM